MNENAPLKERNLAFFKAKAPDLHRELAIFEPTARLVIDDHGNIDIVNGEDSYFEGDASAYAARQLFAFFNQPVRVSLAHPEPGQLDKYTERFFESLGNRAREAGIEFLSEFARADSYFVAVLGIGLGLHLDELVERTQCQALYLLDTDLEGIYHSLEVYDWENLFRRLEERTGSISFIFNDDAEKLSRRMFSSFRFSNPCSADGFYLFLHRADPALVETADKLRNYYGIFYGELGHFYDEILMLKNAYANLHAGKAVLYRRPPPRTLAAPVFLVACGPSLDKDMDFIRANQDRSVIVSCGSVLRALVVNGITPDFHVEMENIDVFSADFAADEGLDISDVTLIAASTVDAQVLPYFKRVVYFFRSELSPFPILCADEDNCLYDPGPIVLNAGFSFAIEIGASEVYFFGADFGVRDSGLHHAKESYHYTEGAINANPGNLLFDIPVPANFGGDCRCSRGFFLALTKVGRSIDAWGDRSRYFNCSDGALIEGAEPIRSGDLDLPAIEGGKQARIERLIAEFPVFSRQDFAMRWRGPELLAAVDRFCETFNAMLDIAPPLSKKTYLYCLMELLKPGIGNAEAKVNPIINTVIYAFRGTLYMMIIYIEYLSNRCTDVNLFAPIALEELAAGLENLRLLARDVLADPLNTDLPEEDFPTPWVPPDESFTHAELLTANEEVISVGQTGDDDGAQADPPLGGETTAPPKRNAPCPCGSGRKYKHCHG